MVCKCVALLYFKDAVCIGKDYIKDGVDPDDGLPCRARDGGTRHGSAAPHFVVPCRWPASCGGASLLHGEGLGCKACICSATPGACLSGDIAGVHNIPYYTGISSLN